MRNCSKKGIHRAMASQEVMKIHCTDEERSVKEEIPLDLGTNID